MKIVLIGTVEFSKRMLEKLIEFNAQVVGVCGKEKSKFNSDFANLKPLCDKNKIPSKFINNINSKDSYDWIKSLSPDIIFCFGAVPRKEKFYFGWALAPGPWVSEGIQGGGGGEAPPPDMAGKN